MTSDASERQYFTVDEANKRLPLVKAIVKDIVALYADVEDRRERIGRIRGDKQQDAPETVYSEELRESEERLERDMAQLQEYLDELQKLGAELKDPHIGLVDFRTLIDGREAYLCWKHGEDEIAWWHELEAGVQGRQSLLEGMISGESFTPKTNGQDS